MLQNNTLRPFFCQPPTSSQLHQFSEHRSSNSFRYIKAFPENDTRLAATNPPPRRSPKHQLLFITNQRALLHAAPRVLSLLQRRITTYTRSTQDASACAARNRSRCRPGAISPSNIHKCKCTCAFRHRAHIIIVDQTPRILVPDVDAEEFFESLRAIADGLAGGWVGGHHPPASGPASYRQGKASGPIKQMTPALRPRLVTQSDDIARSGHTSIERAWPRSLVQVLFSHTDIVTASYPCPQTRIPQAGRRKRSRHSDLYLSPAVCEVDRP